MRCLLLLLLGLVGSPSSAELFELSFEIEAHLSVRGVKGEVLAGGRLTMEGTRTLGDGLQLSLVEVVEPPWKLYWVDPLGPFGEEVKVASVIDLESGSWPALSEARGLAEGRAEGYYAAWAEGRGRRVPPLDGSFAFVAIGPVAGRFRVRLPADGGMAEVGNQVTGRWLSGPFDQWVGQDWTAVTPGYWFWNASSNGPFDFEPQTYQAMASATEVLSWSTFADSSWPVAARESAIRALRHLAARVSERAKLPTSGETSSGVERSAKPGLERFVFNDGTWIERRVDLAGIPRSVEMELSRQGLSYRFRVDLELTK